MLDVEHEDANRALSGRADDQSAGFGVMQLCEVHVARISDYKEYHIVSHLGNLIKPGDTVLGYVLEGIGESAHATEEEVCAARVLGLFVCLHGACVCVLCFA